MAAIFSNFTTTLIIIGAILAIGIIFEEKFLALEDKFDAYVASLKAQHKAEPVQTQKRKTATATKNQSNKTTSREGFAA